METDNDTLHEPAGDPLKSSAAAFAASALSAIPVAGAFISAGVVSYLQHDASRRINAAFEDLDRRIREANKTPEDLLRDPLFRAGISQLYVSIATHEAESKHHRIQMFLAHRICAGGDGDIVGEGVLRAFAALPASHIEAFLQLISGGRPDSLRSFGVEVGNVSFNIGAIVTAEFPDPDDREYCDSPAHIRSKQLSVLFASLETAGLFRRVEDAETGPAYETTVLAEVFVWHCLEPTG